MQLTLKPGASVAQVAQAHGVNANQVFKWRRAFDRGELSEPSVAWSRSRWAAHDPRAERSKELRARRLARSVSSFLVERRSA